MSNALKFYIDGAWVDPAVLLYLPVQVLVRAGGVLLGQKVVAPRCPLAPGVGALETVAFQTADDPPAGFVVSLNPAEVYAAGGPYSALGTPLRVVSIDLEVNGGVAVKVVDFAAPGHTRTLRWNPGLPLVLPTAAPGVGGAACLATDVGDAV